MKLESLKNVASLLSTKEMGSLVGGGSSETLVSATNKDPLTGHSTDTEKGHYEEVERGGKCYAVWKGEGAVKQDDGTNGTYYSTYEIPCNVVGDGGTTVSVINKDFAKTSIDLGGVMSIDKSAILQ